MFGVFFFLVTKSTFLATNYKDHAIVSQGTNLITLLKEPCQLLAYKQRGLTNRKGNKKTKTKKKTFAYKNWRKFKHISASYLFIFYLCWCFFVLFLAQSGWPCNHAHRKQERLGSVREIRRSVHHSTESQSRASSSSLRTVWKGNKSVIWFIYNCKVFFYY